MSESKKPLNVGQQPNPPNFQKVYSETLQAKNIGVDKILLNINGANSELPSNKNSIIKYSLKQPIELEPGDMVTLVSSFVEEKGLAENTISFEEDFETEMRFLYYKQFDTGDTQSDCTDVGFVQYPKLCPEAFTGTSNNRNNLDAGYMFFSHYEALYSSVVTDCGLNMDFSNKLLFGSDENITSGTNGQLGYLMETCQWRDGGATPENTFYRPVYGKKVIKVNAGNYSVDSLANIISEQMNGSIGANNNSFSDALLDKLYKPDVSFNQGDKFVQTLPFFRNITGSKDDTLDKDIFGTEKEFKNGERQSWARKVEGMCRQIYYSKKSYYDVFLYNQLVIDDKARLPPGGKYPNGREDTDDYHYGVTPHGGDRERTVQLADILEPNFNSGNSAAVNFYVGARHLNLLFENDFDAFYCNPGYEDGTIDANDPFRVPTVYETIQLQVGLDYGITPFYAANGAAYEAKYPFNTRVPGDHSMMFNTLWPVNGITFPGSQNTIPPRNKFAGTSVAEMTFSDSQANRFAFQNFHEFYKLPNIAADGKSTTDYGGQQATLFNSPFYNDEYQGDFADNNPVASSTVSNAVYPVDSTSGIMVNNFCFDLCKDTQVYKDAVEKIRALDNDYSNNAQLRREKLIYDLVTKPFDKFFPDDESAKDVFENSLWHRLGFSYEQLGQISKQVESTSTFGGAVRTINGPGAEHFPGKFPRTTGRATIPNKGIITHNQFDFSKIVSSDGLGLGNPVTTTAGLNLQNYRLSDYFYGKQLPDNIGTSGNLIHLMADSKPLNAANLPSLSAGKSYLLIESDIVKPNYRDVRAGHGNLLGIMSKENATNDTIFGTDPIDFTITEPRILSNITLYIKNPDGTLADDSVVGKNCGFIIQITKPIKPQAVAQVDPP